MSWQARSKIACARYDKSRGQGDDQHAYFKLALNRAIKVGYESPKADRIALEMTRKYFDAPDFTPRLAYGVAA